LPIWLAACEGGETESKGDGKAAERAPRRVPRSAVRSAPRARRAPPLPTAPRTPCRVTRPAPY
ncbi:hypothetical protein ABZ630_15535, partial [Streptomyces albidoflavus]